VHATLSAFHPLRPLTWLRGEPVMFSVRATNRAIPARFIVYCRGEPSRCVKPMGSPTMQSLDDLARLGK
jgi:hypothetical protein